MTCTPPAHVFPIGPAFFVLIARCCRDLSVTWFTFGVQAVASPTIPVKITYGFDYMAPFTFLFSRFRAIPVSVMDVFKAGIPPQIIQSVIGSCWIGIVAGFGSIWCRPNECFEYQAMHKSCENAPIQIKADTQIPIFVLMGFEWARRTGQPPGGAVISALEFLCPDSAVV